MDEFEYGVIEDRILFELELKLTPFIKKSERSSMQILDMLGDIGGFLQVWDILFAFLGGYFSSRFFQAQITEDFYLTKNKSSAKVRQSKAKAIKPKRKLDKAKNDPNKAQVSELNILEMQKDPQSVE